MSEIILSKPELRSIDTTTEALSTTLSKVTGKPYYISNTGTAGNILTVLPTDGSTVELGDGDFQSFIYDGSGWLIGFSGGAIAGGGGNIVWSSEITYQTNELVRYGEIFYKSLQDNNNGNQPDTETAYWEEEGYLSNYPPTELTAISDKADSNETRLDTAESDIDNLETAETAMKGAGWTTENLTDHETRIDTLETDVPTMQGTGWTDENLIDHEDRIGVLESSGGLSSGSFTFDISNSTSGIAMGIFSANYIDFGNYIFADIRMSVSYSNGTATNNTFTFSNISGLPTLSNFPSVLYGTAMADQDTSWVPSVSYVNTIYDPKRDVITGTIPLPANFTTNIYRMQLGGMLKKQ